MCRDPGERGEAMADVFISYRSEDRARAAPVAKALEAEGLTVWWDSDLQVGQDYQETIDTNLRNALLVVVLWTPGSVKSRWVRSEATVADRHGALLPVLLEPCQLPVAFELVQTADLTHWHGDRSDPVWQQLLQNLRTRLEQRQAQAGTTQPPPAMAAVELEALFWSSIKDSNEAADFLSYLSRFPKGHFVELARKRGAELSTRRRRLLRGAALAGVAGVAGLIIAIWYGSRAVVNPNQPPTLPPSVALSEQAVDGARPTVPAVQPPAPLPSGPDSKPSADGTARVPVPEVRGLSVDEAVARLKEAQLKDGRRLYLTLGKYSPGVVYGQRPTIGARVAAGTPVELMVEREKRSGIRSSGHIFLGSTYVWDLDGDSTSGREGNDIRYEASDPMNRLLQPLGGVTMGIVGQGASGLGDCQKAQLSASPIVVRVGAKLCVLTSGGRYAMVTIVDVSDELTIDFDTWDVTTPSQTVTLTSQDSRDFKRGTTKEFVDGDFYVTIDSVGAAMFWANNKGQRGLVDLGDVGVANLSDIKPPRDGYYKFGLPVVAGHAYVSLAREDGHFVIFRVTGVTDKAVTVEYAYR